MEEENTEQADSSQILSLSSPKSLQSSIEPNLMKGINEDDLDNNIQKTPSVSSVASMQQEHPTSLILTDNKSKLLEISVEQSVPIDDSVILSTEVDRGELSSTNEIPDYFPSSSNEAFNSKEAQDDSMAIQSSEVIPSADCEASMQQERPMSHVATVNKSSSQEISIEGKVPIGDSITLSPKVENNEFPSINEVPEPSSVSEVYESKGTQDDLIATESSEVNVVSQYLLGSREGVHVDAPCTDSDKVDCTDSITLSPRVENNEFPSTNEVPDDFPSSISEVYESKGTQDDLIATESSEVKVVSQYLLGSREGVPVDAPCTDSNKVGCETPPAILKIVKEDKNLFVHRLQKRQMSLAGTRQKVSSPVSRSVSVRNLRMDNTTVDTTTHIESVKVAASKFGGSINWKTRRAQPAQGSGHTVLELDKLKNEVSKCKHKAEVAEVATVSVFDDLERTNKLIDELKHVLERKQAEEVDAKEDLKFFQLIVREIEEGAVSGDSGIIEGKLMIIQERNKETVTKLKLVKDESRKLQEDYDSLLIEQDISFGKAQAACTLSKETERQVEDLTLELKRLKGLLDLDRATLYDAEKRKEEASILREIDCSVWEVNLRQAGEELKRCDKLSSIEELKSELDTSLNLLLHLNNELATCMEANPTEQALKQEGGTYKSTEEVTPPRNELEEYSKSIAKVTNELRALKITSAALKSELNKERAALAAMQQRETMASITIQSLKMEIKHSLQELEAVRAKAECRDKKAELPNVLQNAAWEADKAKSIATNAQEELRNTREEIDQTMASLSAMELTIQTVLREIEAAKESERLALSAIRALEEETKATANIEQGSAHQMMIIVDLDEYTSLMEKAHRAEALVQERAAAAIAQVEEATASESRTLSRLDETFTALEEQKQALLHATEQADRATEGKLAMEQELRKWRQEGSSRQRRGASSEKASNSETRPPPRAHAAEIVVVARSGDAKCASREDGGAGASVHPLSDASGRSSPNDVLVLHATAKKKARKLSSFFPRFFMFLGRKRIKAGP